MASKSWNVRADAGTRRRDHVSPSLEWKFNQYLKCARRFQESVTYIDKALVRRRGGDTKTYQRKWTSLTSYRLQIYMITACKTDRLHCKNHVSSVIYSSEEHGVCVCTCELLVADIFQWGLISCHMILGHVTAHYSTRWVPASPGWFVDNATTQEFKIQARWWRGRTAW